MFDLNWDPGLLWSLPFFFHPTVPPDEGGLWSDRWIISTRSCSSKSRNSFRTDSQIMICLILVGLLWIVENSLLVGLRYTESKFILACTLTGLKKAAKHSALFGRIPMTKWCVMLLTSKLVSALFFSGHTCSFWNEKATHPSQNRWTAIHE